MLAGLTVVAEDVTAVVLSGDRLRATDGRVWRLAGIEAAQPPMGADSGRRWPLAESAKTALAALVEGQRLTMKAEDAHPDRHGRLVVHVYRADGVWVQRALVEQGWARARPVPGDTFGMAELLSAEAAARNANAGIWATRAYGVRPADDPDAVARDAGTLTLVEGVIKRADARAGRVYLDFGDDWRRDFSVVMAKSLLRSLVADGQVAALTGRRVRVRGWPQWNNGPQISIDLAQQVEILD